MKHIKMPKALAEKWLANLRNGEYKQCTEKMTDGVGFCCLGVLQMGISGLIIKEEGKELPSSSWLRDKNIEFFDCNGDKSCNPHSPTMNENFTNLNDTKLSFTEIADLLETEIEYNDK